MQKSSSTGLLYPRASERQRVVRPPKVHDTMTKTPIRELLAEACEHRRRGDIALAIYLETLAAVAMRTAFIQGRAA